MFFYFLDGRVLKKITNKTNKIMIYLSFIALAIFCIIAGASAIRYFDYLSNKDKLKDFDPWD